MPSADTAAGVLVSMKPEFAIAIAEGRKTVELRRRFPLVQPGVVLVIYATQPVGAVLGFAPIRLVESAPVSKIWRSHRHRIGIDRARFDSYFAGRSDGFAISLGQYEPLVPIALKRLRSLIPGFRAPQSWRYLGEDLLATIRSDMPSAT